MWEKYIQEVWGTTGVLSGTFEANPWLYDLLIERFQADPSQLLSEIRREIKLAASEESASVALFKEAVEQARAINFANSPEGRRANFKVVPPESVSRRY